MSKEKRTKDTITLGSGDLYIKEFDGSIPNNEELETEANRYGYIKGGATAEYTPESYTAEDDSGQVKKTIITKEEVKFKTGLITWNAETLKRLISTGRITTTAGKRTLKIGGLKNYNNQSYILRFVHKDEVDGDVRVTIVGKNTAGISLAFVRDSETTVDTEFTAEPLDKEGTLIIIEEEVAVSA